MSTFKMVTLSILFLTASVMHGQRADADPRDAAQGAASTEQAPALAEWAHRIGEFPHIEAAIRDIGRRAWRPSPTGPGAGKR